MNDQKLVTIQMISYISQKSKFMTINKLMTIRKRHEKVRKNQEKRL